MDPLFRECLPSWHTYTHSHIRLSRRGQIDACFSSLFVSLYLFNNPSILNGNAKKRKEASAKLKVVRERARRGKFLCNFSYYLSIAEDIFPQHSRTLRTLNRYSLFPCFIFPIFRSSQWLRKHLSLSGEQILVNGKSDKLCRAKAVAGGGRKSDPEANEPCNAISDKRRRSRISLAS